MSLPRFLLGVLATLWLVGAAQAQTRIRNVVNQPFASVSNGLQSAQIVDVGKSASPAQIDAAVEARLKALWRGSSRSVKSASRTRATSRKRALYPMSTLVAVRQGGKLIVKAPTRAMGGGTLNFVFSNFQGKRIVTPNGSIVIEDFLKALLLGDGQREGLYNKIVRIYGQPAWSGTVEVRSMGFYDDGETTDPQRVLFGAYDLSQNRILLPLYDSIDSTAHAFLLGILHAFHGPAALQYDAWEQGFLRAAATVIARDAQLGFLDPSNNFFYTLLRRYDILNQPALAGPRFIPPSQANIAYEGRLGVYKMLWARMAMSGAAWLKCYIENPNFFKDFNAAYYARLDPGSAGSLAGNVPQLKEIAASVLPNVEGLPFADWFSRQYVLDSAVTPGAKLYASPYDISRETRPDGVRNDVSVAMVYFRSTFDGASGDDELLLGGRGYALYTDAQGQRFPTGGAQGDSTQLEEGEGFLTATFLTGPGNEIGRLTIDTSIGSESARLYVPLGVTGDLLGVGLGTSQGNVRVEQGTVLPGGITRFQETIFAEKAFGVKLGGLGDELFQSQFIINDGGIVRVYRRNLGDFQPGEGGAGDLAACLVVLPSPEASGGLRTVSHVFERNASGAPHLVSFPVRPLTSSVEQTIALPTSDFLITSFDTGKGSYETLVPGVPSVPALTPGRGFWFKYAPSSGSSSVRLSLTGIAPPTDTDFAIAARYGWNLIGSPFDASLAVANIRVRLQDRDPLSWEEAVAANLVLASVYDFDPQTGYRAATNLNGSEWRGYWVRVLSPSGVTLLLPGPDVTRKLTRSLTPGGGQAGNWAVRLTARQSDHSLPFGGMAQASLGAKNGATRAVDSRDEQSPPDILDSLKLAFGTGPLPGGGRIVGDFRDVRSAARGTWTLTVSSPRPGPVRLTWDGLGSLPRASRLVLLDGERRIPLKESSGYTLTLEPGKSRALTLIAEPNRLSPLRILAVTTTTRLARQGGVGIRATLSGEAELLGEVTTLSGRRVAQLAGSRARAGESTSLRWDGKNQDGAALPAGAYLLTLTARGENGETARLVRPVTVIR